MIFYNSDLSTQIYFKLKTVVGKKISRFLAFLLLRFSQKLLSGMSKTNFFIGYFVMLDILGLRVNNTGLLLNKKN